MTNILLEGYDIDAAWLYDELKNYIKPDSKAAIVAFSFRDSRVKSIEDWDLLYDKEHGRYYGGIVGSLMSYGISEENITFLNYFTDSKETAASKIEQADIIYFLGGLPDRMMDRINEFGLYDILLRHKGIIMGYSAGAVIQLSEYHLSPDEDYPEFGYYDGIPYCSDFYLEVHYEGTKIQNDAIARVIRERRNPVYATHYGEGAIIVNNGEVRTVGKVEIFR